MESREIRNLFTEFFRKKGHEVVQSSSLIPFDDPTLLFTSAGMVQFKKLWSTAAQPPYPRAVSCQKCMRAGGKDSDLENVGESPNHHTFFEMLGNFSFGDYFKKEAIDWAYEFSVNELGLPPDKIWVTYHEKDEETMQLWKRYFPDEKIVPLGDKDNFWGPVGDTGPCGPCTELYIDKGPGKACGSGCRAGCDCGRFIEFWNLVFQQYEKMADGSLAELGRKGVDTGMGLERITGIMQDAPSNYETDLFLPIIREIEAVSGEKYSGNKRLFRIISDHLRAVVFLIGDNVLPANEGRGYVLRRLIRRAILSGVRLGITDNFLYKMTRIPMDIMKDVYPSLSNNRKLVEKIVMEEEERFLSVLQGADRAFESVMTDSAGEVLSGIQAFRLYDTHGIPKDIIRELAEQRSVEIDWQGFERELNSQKINSRKDASEEMKYEKIHENSPVLPTVFMGYDAGESRERLTAIYRMAGSNLYSLVFEKTPFYPERGGQVGDRGLIENGKFRFRVSDTRIDEKELIHHLGRLEEGSIEDIKSAGSAELRVDSQKRRKVSINHTATHLLHYSLRSILGSGVKQAGSYVGDDKLRFDFVCSESLTDKVVLDVETAVRDIIFNDVAVRIRQMDINDAVGEGVVALFMEKYDDIVRVIDLGDFHSELCGGTHVKRTGDIFLFTITGFESVGRNLKRIEAVTYKEALKCLERSRDMVNKAVERVDVDRQDKLLLAIDALIESRHEDKKLIRRYEDRLAESFMKSLMEGREAFSTSAGKGFYVSGEVDVENNDSVSRLADNLLHSIEKGVVFLASESGGKLFIVIKVSEDFKEAFPAGSLVKEIAPIIGGGGGGSPVFARGSGSNVKDVGKAFERCRDILKGRVIQKKAEESGKQKKS